MKTNSTKNKNNLILVKKNIIMNAVSNASPKFLFVGRSAYF